MGTTDSKDKELTEEEKMKELLKNMSPPDEVKTSIDMIKGSIRALESTRLETENLEVHVERDNIIDYLNFKLKEIEEDIVSEESKYMNNPTILLSAANTYVDSARKFFASLK